MTRGYRVDVEPNVKPFLSLCLRTGTYMVRTAAGDQPIPLPPDEGFLKGSSTTSVPGDDEELYLHEAAAVGGWSLVAERPGRRVMPDETIDDGTTRCPDAGVPLVTEFHATPGRSRVCVTARRTGSGPGRRRRATASPRRASIPNTSANRDLLPVGAGAVTRRDPADCPYGEGESLSGW